MVTLFLTVGLPGAGKTTLARRLEAEHDALRLTKDEWVKALYGAAKVPGADDVVEGRLVDVALRVLELGTSVVLDFGLWTRAERSALRQGAADAGSGCVVCFLDVDPDEQQRRLERRWREAPESTWAMSGAELAAWRAAFETPTPGELDGSEPVGDPPDGVPTWAEWRARRWPRSTTLEG